MIYEEIEAGMNLLLLGLGIGLTKTNESKVNNEKR